MKQVQLSLAYTWQCPKCTMINVEPINSIKKYKPPKLVQCLACEFEYEALPIADKQRSK